MRSLNACVLLAGLGLGGSAWADETHQGQLDETDQTLEGGEPYDQFQVVTQPGERLVVDLTSADFDPYLAIISPSNVFYRVDTYLNRVDHARFDMLDLAGGAWTVVATVEGASRGGYTLAIQTQPVELGAELIHEVGELAAGDSVTPSLHLVDTYEVELTAGQTLMVDVTARRFDTVLQVQMPGGELAENDDFMDAINHSRLEALAREAGTAVIQVRAFDAEGQGRYVIRAHATSVADASVETVASE